MKDRLIPLCLVGLIGLLAIGIFSRHLREIPSPTGLNIDRMMHLPVLEGGRIKPLDTIARSTLMVISQKQTYRDENGDKVSAADWLAELLLDPQSATERKVFRIDHPDVVGLIGFSNDERKFFSLAEIVPHFSTLEKQFALIPDDRALQTPFDRELLKLRLSVSRFDGLANTLVLNPVMGGPTADLNTRDKILNDLQTLPAEDPDRANARNAWQLFNRSYQNSDRSDIHVVYPPTLDGEWTTVARSLIEPKPADAVVRAYAELAEAYRNLDTLAFQAAIDKLDGLVEARVSVQSSEDLELEFFLNKAAPFILSMELYILVLICAFAGWLVYPRWLLTSALVLLALTFIVHSLGLIARMDVEGRPPVTTLYSSAIFVGWGGAFLCLILESFLRNGVASVAAALIGFPTLIVAHHLSFSGDTIEVMRAVLDSNFWLATHVVVVTMGYSATFLAGALAVVYLLFDRIIGRRTERFMQEIDRMVYGVLCFALLFSFVGTVLGGIWADQSWGRFWGWDPKENGALMIVLWNAVILHARWSKVASTLAIMQLAVLGNVITAWSWFGTNLLGIGLHSYGFTEKGFFWLFVFVVTQVTFILLGLLPRRSRVDQRALS